MQIKRHDKTQLTRTYWMLAGKEGLWCCGCQLHLKHINKTLPTLSGGRKRALVPGKTAPSPLWLMFRSYINLSYHFGRPASVRPQPQYKSSTRL